MIVNFKFMWLTINIIQLIILFFIFKQYKKMPLSEKLPTFPIQKTDEALASQIAALIVNDAIQDAHIKNLEDYAGAIHSVEEAPIADLPPTDPNHSVE